MPTYTQGGVFRSTKADGTPNASGFVYTYAAGTLTPLATFVTPSGAANTNPVALGVDGCATICLSDGLSYRFRETTAAAVLIKDTDNITGNSASVGFADLSSPLRTKGSSLVAYIHSGAGAVARTVQDRLDDIVYAENYRQPGDPDDTLSIQRVLNLGFTCGLRAGASYVAFGLVAVAGTGIVCPVGRATISVPAGANLTGLTINADNFTLSGVNFTGGSTFDFKANPGTAIGTRIGIAIGGVYGSGTNRDGITVSNVDVSGFDHSGILGQEVQFNAVIFGKRSSLHNVYAYRCYNGIWYGQRFEYIVSTNVHAYDCCNGLQVQGGNNTFTGCKSLYCYINFYLTTGYNDAHGNAVACSFNHAYGGYGVFCQGVVNGFTFTSCAMWFTTLRLENSTGISIRNCQIANTTIQIVSGGVNSIDDNQFVAGVTTAFTGNVFTTFRRNKATNSSTSIDLVSTYSDLWMVSKTSTAITVLQTNTTPAFLNHTFGTAMWMGQPLAALSLGGVYAVIQKTGIISTNVVINFQTAAGGQTVRMNLVRLDRTGTTRREVLTCGINCPASAANLTIQRSVEWEFEYGELIGIELWTNNAVGFIVDGVDVRHALIY